MINFVIKPLTVPSLAGLILREEEKEKLTFYFFIFFYFFNLFYFILFYLLFYLPGVRHYTKHTAFFFLFRFTVTLKSRQDHCLHFIDEEAKKMPEAMELIRYGMGVVVAP